MQELAAVSGGVGERGDGDVGTIYGADLVGYLVVKFASELLSG